MVTGTATPVSSKIWVMPIFFPISPLNISFVLLDLSKVFSGLSAWAWLHHPGPPGSQCLAASARILFCAYKDTLTQPYWRRLYPACSPKPHYYNPTFSK
jgi:hypothetical protein